MPSAERAAARSAAVTGRNCALSNQLGMSVGEVP
jgi:hypothetical protein